MNPDILLFFDRKPEELALYEAFEAAILQTWPDTQITVHKTQISLHCRRIFACVSLPRRRKKDSAAPCIIVSFGLLEDIASPRITESSRINAKRRTYHVPLSGTDEIDSELMAWLAQAHNLADRPGERLP